MLHELIEYAKVAKLNSEPGFKPKCVRWLLVFHGNGDFAQIVDLTGGEKKSKGRLFDRCPELTFGELISNGLRHFLVDSVDKIALLTKDEVTTKDRAQHDSFVGLLQSASSILTPLGPIAAALDRDETLEQIRDQLSAQKAKPTDSATLAVMDGVVPTIFVEQADWHDWWRGFRQQIAASKQAKGPTKKTDVLMRCLLSGQMVSPVATQIKVSGLSDVGGLATGDVLSSFDKDAFGHYGFSQGQNAAMSEEMVKGFTDSLNHLIQNRSRRLAGTKVVYWFSKQVAAEDDPIADLFGNNPFGDEELSSDSQASWAPDVVSQQMRLQQEARAGRLLDRIRSGDKRELVDCQFFALTLSGNSGRVVIRDWMQGSFEQLARNVQAWFDDLAIISRDGSRVIASHKFAAVLAAFVRDLKDVPAPAVTALWQAALQRRPIPVALMAQTLARVRIDVIQGESARHARLGLLRAFCIRNSGVPSMSVDLDPSLDSPAYLCGRIMALLADVQKKALGDVGAGVIQRYYAAASATPALVLGRLVRTAQVAHLPKIDGGLRFHFESQLSDLWGQMKSAPPATLSLEDQTLFAMGFYQQQASRFQKKLSSDESAVVLGSVDTVE